MAALGSEDFADFAESLGDKRSGAVVVGIEQGQALVHIRTDARALRRKIEQYRDSETKKGAPRNEPLIARIEQLRAPTLSDLSLGELDDDEVDLRASYWVELWTLGGRLATATDRARVQREIGWLAQLGGHIGAPARFGGTERDIYLVRLTGEVLAELPGLVPEVYELHFAPRVRLVEAVRQGEAIGAVPAAVEELRDGAAVVAVHDTGISAEHPYLKPVLIGSHSVVPGEPDTTDRHGHGTEMAGIATYPDYLQGVAAGSLRPQNWLVGIRLIATPGVGPHDDDPGLWAERTENAIKRAEAIAAGKEVVHSLSVGAENPLGVRTAWSIGVDRLAWNGGVGRIIVVAAGNVPDAALALEPGDYPGANFAHPMCQPAQAWNALTVGGFTDLDGPPAAGTGVYPQPLAPRGGISPYSATDVGGSARPIKPDIVKEAGNTAPGGGLANCGSEHLSLWTTSHQHSSGRLSIQTWATSPAAASAAADIAILARQHPAFSPAALRALYVHTARWTQTMVTQFPDRKERVRAVGFGVPNLSAALGAASNRPVFIYEGQLAPGKRQAQMLRVPLPDSFLSDHAELSVRLAITLACFIEPTETGRRYAGGRLKWEMQGPAETEQQLRNRVNALASNASGNDDVGSGQSYRWKVGRQLRSRGTLQHDYADLEASELAGDRLLAVYPTLGWWEDREETKNLSIPYCVVISVDFGDQDVDIYAAIQAQISNSVIV
ncbi:S8 family peptidase [Nocardia asiatica]|uniref:S8 family peptidase n=1 Tax=Nocardia asiatica TaxID=209252 RepID=UPI003EE0F8AA